MKKRVVVAMSGGVDSAVAAALLVHKGYEAIGMTMCFNLPDAHTGRPSCCGLQGIEDARRICAMLGIKHYVVNMQKALSDKIIDDFCAEYAQGRTPNPCVRCNQFLKFDILLKKALALDAHYLATGHYARIDRRPAGNPRPATGDRRPVTDYRRPYCLKKGKDPHKDQSYFLYRLGQEQLKHTLFPLGAYTKDQVRLMARRFKLAVADKPGSQEICFIAGRDYREFLRERGHASLSKPGDVLDKNGVRLGRHRGIAFYTVGQRQGLGIAYKHPLYITRIDVSSNTITVGSYEDACRRSFTVIQPHWVRTPGKMEIAARVKIRYNHTEQPARIMCLKDRLRVRFNTPQFALTPGQSAVFYRRSTVLGGGIIDEVFDGKE